MSRRVLRMDRAQLDISDRWPSLRNTGYARAPGFTSLTTYGGANFTSDTIYRFYSFGSNVPWVGGDGSPTGTPISNVTFIGCRFVTNDDVVCAVRGDNISFIYCSFEALTAPPVSHANGYQYAIEANGGYYTAVQQLTVSHCEFFGFANAIDASGSTQSKPHLIDRNWFHDCRADGGTDHTDAVGAFGLDNAGSYMVITNNRIDSVANTNAIGYQFSSTGFNHVTITGNLISGWNNAMNFGGVFPDSANSTASYITFKDNTFSTQLQVTNGVNHQNWWATTGSVWRRNRWMVPAVGAWWGNRAHNGWYWLPTAANAIPPDDALFVGPADYAG